MADESVLAHSPTLAAHDGSPADAAKCGDDTLAIGTQVGEYVVERFIGAGAMGEVYGGRHPVIGKRVAIKVLRHELAASPEAAERFIREARAANQIDHENVVDVFSFGRLDDGRLYLVMDLVEGRSLRAHLINGPLELRAAVEILEPIANALDAAHARGVVHRDLKPDNIVLSNASPPKVMVLDFGIAKLISTANAGTAVTPGTLTGAGTWLGTPGYMAPEQWSVDGAGPASDRYALGVIAFELLAGAQPFSASSVPQMMEQHFRAEVPTLSSRGASDLPAALDRVLRKALAKDPEQRYATAGAFVGALRDAAGTAPLRARGAVVPADGGSRRLWIPAVAGIVVLAAGVIAVVTLGRDKTARRRVVASDPTHGDGHGVPAGTVPITVTSSPVGAEVRGPDGAASTTPTELYAVPGTKLDVTVRKGGYLPEHRSLTIGPSGTVVDVKLVASDGFAGVWQLPNGELRAFARRDDHVDAFKLPSVSGARRFLAQYTFALTDTGIQFGGEDVVADPKAPDEPTCNVRMRVDYVYDPAGDKLEQRREHVELDFVNGTCVEKARRVEPSLLVRVDRASSESHELAMPVGIPDEKGAKPTKAAKTKASKPAPARTTTATNANAPPVYKKQTPSKMAASANDIDSQIVPSPNATVPQAQQQAPPPQQVEKR